MTSSRNNGLNVIGDFLSVTAESCDGVPNCLLRHHDVDGDSNEELLVAE